MGMQAVLALIAGDVCEQHVGGSVLLVLGKMSEFFNGFFKQPGHMPAL